MSQRETVLEVLPRPRRAPLWATGFLRFSKRLVQEKPLGAFGGLVILTMLIVGLFAQLIAPFAYDEPDFFNILAPPGAPHVLGTDHLGRDMLSRIIVGAQVSMIVVAGAVSLRTIITAVMGIVPVWYGGRVDTLTQRLVVETWITLPFLLILLSLASLLGPGLLTIIFILGLSGISHSRVIRGTVLSLKETPFIDAARAIGAGTPRIMVQHLLPNTFAPLIILATIGFGTVILAEATLSFLGYGVPPPFPSWGRMLSSDSMSHFYQAPWLVIWPGMVLTLAVFGSNVFGDALRDLLDPRLRGGSGRAIRGRRP